MTGSDLSSIDLKVLAATSPEQERSVERIAAGAAFVQACELLVQLVHGPPAT